MPQPWRSGAHHQSMLSSSCVISGQRSPLSLLLSFLPRSHVVLGYRSRQPERVSRSLSGCFAGLSKTRTTKITKMRMVDHGFRQARSGSLGGRPRLRNSVAEKIRIEGSPTADGPQSFPFLRLNLFFQGVDDRQKVLGPGYLAT